MIKLIDIIPSKSKGKRLTAVFNVGGKEKRVHFGSEGAYTYIDGGSDDRRKNYLARHAALKTEDWDDPLTAGALSRWILWGDSPNIDKNIASFKRRFHL